MQTSDRLAISFFAGVTKVGARRRCRYSMQSPRPASVLVDNSCMIYCFQPARRHRCCLLHGATDQGYADATARYSTQPHESFLLSLYVRPLWPIIRSKRPLYYNILVLSKQCLVRILTGVHKSTLKIRCMILSWLYRMWRNWTRPTPITPSVRQL